ncbi:MAG: hypothetical protein H0T43_01215 [Solirubrobacterales bacterium]|nr:hypothetical protein [Solirubrobacterales bacterium]
MGLLDDAIREHLELKRRRGADAGEVSREEQEALAPARRPPETAPAPAEARGPDLDDLDEDLFAPLAPEDEEIERTAAEEELEQLEEEGLEEEGLEEDLFEDEPSIREAEAPAVPLEPRPPTIEPPPTRVDPPPAPIEPPPTRVDPPPAAVEPPLPVEDEWEDETAAIIDRPTAPAPERSFPPSRSADEPELADDEPDIVPADDEPDGEDLLEETPEFLEETPEHDRLWFEQRPPRDFDFGN